MALRAKLAVGGNLVWKHQAGTGRHGMTPMHAHMHIIHIWSSLIVKSQKSLQVKVRIRIQG